jgi:hypothetical protein
VVGRNEGMDAFDVFHTLSSPPVLLELQPLQSFIFIAIFERANLLLLKILGA